VSGVALEEAERGGLNDAPAVSLDHDLLRLALLLL
jgi:hypothetical protein